jgi:hypothetical protein
MKLNRYFRLASYEAEQWVDLENPPEVLSRHGQKATDEEGNPVYTLMGDNDDIKIIRLNDWVVYYREEWWSVVTNDEFKKFFWPEQTIRKALSQYLTVPIR